MEVPQEKVVNDFTEALHDDNAAVFAGAGLSISAGFVDWRGLLRSAARDVGLDIDKEDDLVAVAQYYRNRQRGRSGINQLIVTELSKRAQLTPNHEILAELPVRTFWTTNYDSLIEDAIVAGGKLPDVKRRPQDLAVNVPRRDTVVYKMHGDKTQVDEAVVTKDDYETYADNRELFSTALRGDLVSKTFLFIGFSFSDPNLAYLLSRIRVLLGENRRDHYCLMRRVNQSDFEKRDDYVYAKTKQDLQIEDLSRYGIHACLLPDFESITTLLAKIRTRYLANTIFISGSASEYGSLTSVEGLSFIEGLAQALTKNRFRIVSGFGLGVGSAVINGVLRQLKTELGTSLDERLLLRPFPLHVDDAEERGRLWNQYRSEMIRHAGIAIFLYGNKRSSEGEVIDADGVLKEFEIARQASCSVVPVGATGYVAKKLHDRVSRDFDQYFGRRSGLKKHFDILARTRLSQTELTAATVDFVTKLRER